MMEKEYLNIPLEKFQFVEKKDISHDKSLKTKPRSYFRDAFSRFCKNKGSIVGAVIIIFLVLFAIITPLCTQYTVSYEDTYFKATLPKSHLFEGTDFWDGCEKKETGEATFLYYYAMGQESGHNAIKNQKYSYDEDTELYSYRLDSYQKNGAVYSTFNKQKYEAIQAYQDNKGIQIIYPTVSLSDRPILEADKNDANYYFKTTGSSRTKIVTDKDGNVIPVYEKYEEGYATDDYTSKMRIEGEDGIMENGVKYYYSYARPVSDNMYECRINYYEYYIYYHTQVEKDGITEPCFLFGTTGDGKDILTCLSSGARFSFIFAIAVAVVNLVVGAIYGAVEGYYGGKIDLVMERISDVLSAVPSMIVITLLKLHMGGSSQILVLFISFFATGWIGMASSTRMQFYRYKNQEYVLAARTLGAKDRRVIWKHIFPNAIGTLITGCALIIPSMIYSETSLSYLGIINLSTGNITSVGTLIADGQSFLATSPFITMFPTAFLILLMLSFNLFGNGLRDAFNPTLRGSEG